MSIDQQAGQQARLSRFRPAPMIAGIGGELASNNGPRLIVDERPMLARVEAFEGLRAAVRFGFNPKKSGPDHAVSVIFPARAESER